MSEATIAHWEVTRAKNAGQKSNPHGGQLDKWYVGLRNLDGGSDCEDAYWQRKSPSEVTVGDQVYGKVEEGDYGFRFYLEKDEDVQRPRSSEASTSNNSKSATSSGETNWEVRNAEIRRQHSQEMAVRLLLGRKQGLEGVDAKAELEASANWFDQDAIAAGQRASQGQTPSTSRSDSPAAPEQSSAIDFTGARKEEPSSTLDRDHIMQLLSSAGLFYAGAQEKVADFIMGPLLLEGRSDAALSALQDHERQANALTQLKTSTERWTGQPLPQGDALDGQENVPF